jgi:hypothetical protein
MRVSEDNVCEEATSCMISGFSRGVNEIFLLPECETAQIVSYRHFGTIYLSHFQGSSRNCLILEDGTDRFS